MRRADKMSALLSVPLDNAFAFVTVWAVSFVAEFNRLPIDSLLSRCHETEQLEVRAVLDKPALSLADFAVLISPTAAGNLEEQPAEACTLGAQLDFIVGHRALAELGEKSDAAGNLSS